MTRHEDVYFTCNGCGSRLGEAWTEVRAVNTDPAAVEPEHDYDLCAKCWLDVYPLLDKVAIDRQNAERVAQGKEYRSWHQFVYDNPGFEG